MTTPLDYLDFDYSEDTEGIGTFDAMASVVPQRLAALHAEVAQVLAWAEARFPDGRGALEDGAQWDYDLQETREPAAAGRPGVLRHTVTLSIGGSPEFCAALREQFALD
jgi:hypothetical protein